MIPQVVASVNKKDKSRLASQIKQNQDNSKASGIDLLAVTHFKSEPLAHYANVTSVFEAQVYSGDLNTGLNRSDGLRAPPAL